MRKFQDKVVFYLHLALISGLGFFLVCYCTVWGAGLISDSFQYVASARSLAAGNRLGFGDDPSHIIPLTQYPPLFSVILAIFERAGIDGFVAARFMNAALFALNIGLIGLSIKKISHSIGFSLIGAFLITFSVVLSEAHTWVLSEPLFIFFSLLSYYWLDKYLESSNKAWLIASALAVSLAILTRYVGLALLPAAWIIILSKPYTNLRRKWSDLGVYSLIGLIPIVLWTVKNYFESGLINNRSLQWVPLTIKNLYSMVNTLVTWFLPANLVTGRERWVIPLLLIFIIGSGLIFYFSKRKPFYNGLFLENYQKPLFRLHTFYIFFYIIMIVASKTLFDKNMGMTDRMLSPVLISMIIPGSALAASLWRRKNRLLQVLVGASMIYLVVYFATTSLPVIEKYHRQGIGLARKSWHTSQVIQSLPQYASLPLYSNSPSTLYFWTGRMGKGVLTLDRLIQSGSNEKAILVVFYHIPPNNRIYRLEKELKLLKSDSLAKIYLYEP